MYSRIYKSALITYKKSELYQRELALNCVSSVIPFSSRSKYYKYGIRGIEEYKDGLHTNHNLYVDISYLFSDMYDSYLSFLTYLTIAHGSHKCILDNSLNIYVISNELCLSGKEIHSIPNLYFNIDISSFDYVISNICLNRDNLLNLCYCNPNLVVSNMNQNLYAHLYAVRGMRLDVDEDVYLLTNLMNLLKGFTLNLFIPATYEIRIKHLVQVFSKLSVSSAIFNFNCPSYGVMVNNLSVTLPSDFDIEQFHYNVNPFHLEGMYESNPISICGRDCGDGIYNWHITV